MKYGKKYMFVACAALLLGMQSCDLEEYNPAGSTPDNVYKEQAGFEFHLVNPFQTGITVVYNFIQTIPRILNLTNRSCQFFIFGHLTAITAIGNIDPKVATTVQ
jgi:hypothetical protein